MLLKRAVTRKKRSITVKFEVRPTGQGAFTHRPHLITYGKLKMYRVLNQIN